MKRILILLSIFLSFHGVSIGQIRETEASRTLQDFYDTHLKEYSSKSVSEFKRQFELIIGESVTLSTGHSDWLLKAQILLETAGPQFYQLPYHELIDTLLYRYTQDALGQNRNALDACRDVFSVKDICMGRWPIEQAWNYQPRLDVDYSQNQNYSRPGWGEVESALYQEILDYQPGKQGYRYYSYPDSIAERVLERIDNERLQTEFLLFYLGKLLTEHDVIETMQIIEGGLPQGIYELILESSSIRDTSKATLMLTLAKLSTELSDKSRSAHFISGIGEYLRPSLYKDADLVDRVVRYQMARSKLYYEQLGLDGIDGAEIEADKLSEFVYDIKDQYHVFQDDYLESFNRRTWAWINESDPDMGTIEATVPIPYLQSMIIAIAAKERLVHQSDRFMINEIVYSIATYRNRTEEQKRILLESAFLVKNNPLSYSKSEKNMLFLRFVRFFGDINDGPSLIGLRSLDVSVMEGKLIDLFSFSPLVYRTPSTLNNEELRMKSSEVYNQYLNSQYPFDGIIEKLLLDPIFDYAKEERLDRYSLEMLESQLKFAARSSGEEIYQRDFLFDRQNRSFESLVAGRAQVEGRSDVREQGFNKTIDEQSEILVDLDRQVREVERLLSNKLEELEESTQLNESIKKENVLLTYNNDELNKANESLETSNTELFFDNEELSNQLFLTLREILYQWLVIGALALFLALAIWQYFRAKKAKQRAIESERKERMQAFTISQIGHLGPDVVQMTRMRMRDAYRSKQVEYSFHDFQPLNSLGDLLRKFQECYHSQSTHIHDEIKMVLDYVDLRFSTKSSKASNLIDIDYGSGNQNYYVPTFVLFNLIVNAFEHGIVDMDNHVKVQFIEKEVVINVILRNKFNRKKKLADIDGGAKLTGSKYVNEIIGDWNNKSEKNLRTRGYGEEYITEFSFERRDAS